VVVRRSFHSGDLDVKNLLVRTSTITARSSQAVGGTSKDSSGDEQRKQKTVTSRHRVQADLIYVIAKPGDAAPLVRKLRAAGYRQPIMGSDTFDSYELVTAAQATGGNVWFTTHAALGLPHQTAPMRKFAEYYRLAYGRSPESSFAGLGFDAVNLVAQAITKAGSATPSAVHAALQTCAYSRASPESCATPRATAAHRAGDYRPRGPLRRGRRRAHTARRNTALTAQSALLQTVEFARTGSDGDQYGA